MSDDNTRGYAGRAEELRAIWTDVDRVYDATREAVQMDFAAAGKDLHLAAVALRSVEQARAALEIARRLVDLLDKDLAR